MILVSPSLWEKTIRNRGQNVAQGAIWEKTMNLHSKTEDKTLNCKSQQRSSRGRKSELQATDNNSSSSSHGLHPLARSPNKGTTSEAITSEVPT